MEFGHVLGQGVGRGHLGLDLAGLGVLIDVDRPAVRLTAELHP